jgi:predicted P-loop ATPase
MTGKWCVELAELGELFRYDQRDAAIAFLTRLTDRYRPAYGRGAASDHPRRCVFLGSANGHAIYTDPHGADVRRIWILETREDIDVARVRELRDRIWSEVYEATREDRWDGPFLVEGEPHWLVGEEKALHTERAAMFRDMDPWQTSFAAILRRTGHDDEGRRETTVERVLGQLGHDVKTLTKRETNRAANILRTLGCTEQRGVARKGVKMNVWKLPDDFPSVRDN